MERQKRAKARSSPNELKATTKGKTTDVKTKTVQAANGNKKSTKHYDPNSPERVRQIIAGLDQMYPAMTCALTHRSAWELLVATILSAQCTDVRVNMVTPILFEKYPAVRDFASLRSRTIATGYSLHRILPEQIEVPCRRRTQASRGLWRRSSSDDGGIA
jgi:Predicted EndoIII-related endonuclease